jgi:hypothetical protein
VLIFKPGKLDIFYLQQKDLLGFAWMDGWMDELQVGILEKSFLSSF